MSSRTRAPKELHRTTWRVAVVTVLGLASVTVAPTARADIYGTNVRWATTNVPVKDHSGLRGVRNGVHQWDVTNLNLRAGGGSCLSGGVPQGCIDISQGHLPDPTWAADAERWTVPDGTIVGCTVVFGDQVTDRAGTSWRALIDDIAAHEVGHCVGHAHTSDPAIPSIMQPVARNWNGLQPYDVSEDLHLYPFPVQPAGAGNGNHSNLTVERFILRAG